MLACERGECCISRFWGVMLSFQETGVMGPSLISTSHAACILQSEASSLRPKEGTSLNQRTSLWGSRQPQTKQCTRRRAVPYAALASLDPDDATEKDAEYMRHCIRLAKKALGFTSPNPLVGCVIVKDGHIIGQGFHPKAGEPHAEVFALREAGMNAKGSTAYVSLEPCNHYGRTPPCTNALIKACVSHVVVGMLDPNPVVAGKGVKTLRKAGIKVTVGVETPSCQAMNEAYIHRMLEKKPFATLRFSMSLDGGFLESDVVDCSAGTYFSRLLQENDAVVVSSGALSDNPCLVSAEAGSKQPLRIVLTRDFDLPLGSSVFDTSVAPTLVIASNEAVLADVQRSSSKGLPSIEQLLQERAVEVVALQDLNLGSVLDVCYERGLCSVLLDVRGGEYSVGLGLKNALEEKIIQKVIVDISPYLTGYSRGGPGLSLEKDVLPLERVSTKMSGGHVIIEGYCPRVVWG